ncbi:unnamed protein product [Pocillopora meandrina]|uniref:Uncharacterized protein n=1 Tax=Pocillopora meandrina TaxID=46732 RepID=A0AAU9WBJ9_9CNID|nr:unnamed protein product [Pocillopora meandrina]
MSFAFKYYRNSEIHYSSDSSESRGSSGEDNDSLVSSLDHGDREITQETVQAPSTAVTLDFQDMPPSRNVFLNDKIFKQHSLQPLIFSEVLKEVQMLKEMSSSR